MNADWLAERLGRPVTAVSVTSSTSDLAMVAARAGAPGGALFVADQQTRGRGRRGRTWVSEPGSSLLLSLVLRPELPTARARGLTLAAGLGVRDAIDARTRVPVRVKWPNDLLVGDKKLGGILCETQVSHGELQAVIVGVGINVSVRAFPPDLADRATSLALLGASQVDREVLLVDVVRGLEARVAEFVQGGLAALLPELRRHDALLGRRVRAGEDVGVAAGIDEDGALLLDGARRVTGGTVTLL